MKLNIANPQTGAQKKIEIDDENRTSIFMDKRMAEEVQGDSLGDEFKGYVFKITGGNDGQGFPMRQGVLVNKRVRLLLRRGMPCYKPKRKGERKRKAVRGCVVGPDIASLSLIIVKRGEQDLPGLTDTDVPKRLGPKRVDKIRKMFNLGKTDDPRDYVVRRKVKTKTGNKIVKKPKIQRLITPAIIHRRKHLKNKVKKRKERSYAKRKQYYERLNKKQAIAQSAKKNIEEQIQESQQSTSQPLPPKPQQPSSKKKPQKPQKPQQQKAKQQKPKQSQPQQQKSQPKKKKGGKK